jgi:hypothetical protein
MLMDLDSDSLEASLCPQRLPYSSGRMGIMVSAGVILAFLQILHTISNNQLELVNSMAPYMESTVLPILKETTTMWQPTDFLPDSSSETFIDEASTV